MNEILEGSELEDLMGLLIMRRPPITSKTTAIINLTLMNEYGFIQHPDDDPQDVWAGNLSDTHIDVIENILYQSTKQLGSDGPGNIYEVCMTLINKIEQVD